MSVLVVCPSRDRPVLLRKMIQSFLDTTTHAELAVAIDDDQVEMYGPLSHESPRVRFHVGSRGPLVPLYNAHVWRSLESHDLFGVMVDDAVFTVPGWDEYALELARKTPVAVVSPSHNYGGHVDMPYVTREWVRRLGWFANPEFSCWNWPVFTGMLGEATTIHHCPADRFHIHHEDLGPRYWDLFDKEAVVFARQATWNLYPLVEKLKA